MAFLRSQFVLLLRLHLLLFLLAAQSLAIAHDRDHLGAKDVNECVVCSVAHGLGNALAASYEFPAIELHTRVYSAAVQTVSSRAQNSRQTARAPPVSL